VADDIVVGVLKTLFTLDTAEFESGVKKVGTSMKDVETSFKKTGDTLTSVGKGLTAALTVPLLGIGAALFKVGSDFDAASDVIQESTGASGAALEALNTSFKHVAATVPASMEDVAAAIADVSRRTGLGGQDLEALTTQMLNLARVGHTEVGPLIAATTRAFGDWSISTENQAGALDFLFKTSQTTGIGVTRLTDLVVQFGAPLRALGFDFETSAALMGRFEKEGVNLETVMSGLRFALGTFAKAGKEPAQALRDVQAAILGAKTESEATAIAFKAFGQRAAVDMSRAIIEGRFNIEELVETLKQSKTTINGVAADTLSLGERFTLLGNRVAIAVEPLAKAFMSALEKAVTAIEPLLDILGKVAAAFGTMPVWAQTAAIAFGAILAAIGPVILVIGQLFIAVSTIAGAFGTAGVAAGGLTAALGLLELGVTSLLGPIGLAVTALGLLYLASQKYHIASKLTTDEIRTQIEELKRAGGTMALSRARSLEAALAEREKTEAVTTATTAVQDQTTAVQAHTAAVTQALPVNDTLRAKLAAVTAEVAGLDAAQKSEIAAGMAMKMTAQQLAATMTVSEAALTVYIEGVKESEKAAKKAAEAHTAQEKAYVSLMREYRDLATIQGMTDEVNMMASSVSAATGRLQDLAMVSVPNLALVNQSQRVLTEATLITTAAIHSQAAAAGYGADAQIQAAIATMQWHAEIRDLGQAFVQLATVAGDSMGSIIRGIGATIVGLDVGTKGVATMKSGFKALGEGSILSGLAGIASGIGGIASAAAAAVQLIMALWKGLKKLFGGGEEGTVVNPARDQFWAQYGGYEAASMALTQKLEEMGDTDPGGHADQLIQAAFGADTKEAFDAAQDAIIALIGGTKFHGGGLVGGIGEVRGLLRAGERVLTGEQNEWFSGLMRAMPALEFAHAARLATGGGNPIEIHLSTYLDGRVVARQVLQHMPYELAAHGVR
jgi:phage-related minor tail protein